MKIQFLGLQAKTLEPSRGGTGRRLNTARRRFMSTANRLIVWPEKPEKIVNKNAMATFVVAPASEMYAFCFFVIPLNPLEIYTAPGARKSIGVKAIKSPSIRPVSQYLNSAQNP